METAEEQLIRISRAFTSTRKSAPALTDIELEKELDFLRQRVDLPYEVPTDWNRDQDRLENLIREYDKDRPERKKRHAEAKRLEQKSGDDLLKKIALFREQGGDVRDNGYLVVRGRSVGNFSGLIVSEAHKILDKALVILTREEKESEK